MPGGSEYRTPVHLSVSLLDFPRSNKSHVAPMPTDGENSVNLALSHEPAANNPGDPGEIITSSAGGPSPLPSGEEVPPTPTASAHGWSDCPLANLGWDLSAPLRRRW